MRWFKRRVFPAFIRDYLNHDFKFWDRVSLENCAFVVLDAETTGLDKKDRIITIGGVYCQQYEINLSTVLDQLYSHEKGTNAAEIHGELPQVTGVKLEVLQDELLQFIGNKVIVGHHIAFDVAKINQMFAERYPGFQLQNRVLDTARLLYRFNKHRYDNEVGGMQNLQLDVACLEYDILIENRHTALGDAYMTAQILMGQLARAMERGIKVVGELSK